MAEGKALAGTRGDARFIKLVGSIRHTMSRDLSAFIDGLFGEGRRPQVVFDLSETADMDSTGLGLVARAARRALEAGAPRPVIAGASHDLGLIMSSMGFGDVFEIVSERTDRPDAWEEIPASAASEVERAGVIVEAHKSLMELSEQNRRVFQDLVDMLEKDFQRKSHH